MGRGTTSSAPLLVPQFSVFRLKCSTAFEYRLKSDVHVLVRWRRAPSCRSRACGCQKQPGSERLTSATQNAACLPLFSALPSRKVLQLAAYTTPFDAEYDRNVAYGQGTRCDHRRVPGMDKDHQTDSKRQRPFNPSIELHDLSSTLVRVPHPPGQRTNSLLGPQQSGTLQAARLQVPSQCTTLKPLRSSNSKKVQQQPSLQEHLSSRHGAQRGGPKEHIRASIVD